MTRRSTGFLVIVTLSAGLVCVLSAGANAAPLKQDVQRVGGVEHDRDVDRAWSLGEMLKWMDAERDRLDAEERARRLRENPPRQVPPGAWVCGGAIGVSPYTRELLSDAQWKMLIAGAKEALGSDDAAIVKDGFEALSRMTWTLCTLSAPAKGSGPGRVLVYECASELLPRAVLDELLAGVLRQLKSKDAGVVLTAVQAAGFEMWPVDTIERRAVGLLEVEATEDSRALMLSSLHAMAWRVPYNEPNPFGGKTREVEALVRQSISAAVDNEKEKRRPSAVRVGAYSLAPWLGERSRELVPILVEKARSGGRSESGMAIRALAEMGPRAAGALPLVSELMDSPDMRLRARAFELLEAIGSASEDHIALVLAGLDDPDEYVQARAARCIVYLRPRATAVVERLERAVKQDTEAFAGYGAVALDAIRSGKAPESWRRRWDE
jgi:hypothetical protein